MSLRPMFKLLRSFLVFILFYVDTLRGFPACAMLGVETKKNPRRRDNIRVYDGGNSYERNSIITSLGEVVPHIVESSWQPYSQSL